MYLPSGEWIDLWRGEQLRGPAMLSDVKQPLERMPIFVRLGSRVPYYPKPVACTDEMDLSLTKEILFDKGYRGFRSSALGRQIDL